MSATSNEKAVPQERKVRFDNLPADVAADIQASVVADYEKKKLARSIIIPTDDNAVKKKLREVGHPICHFGELPSERRSRLRDILLNSTTLEDIRIAESQKKIQQVWFHEGCPELLDARLELISYSIMRAKTRLSKEVENAKKSDHEKTAKSQEMQRKFKDIVNVASQVGDERPLSSCLFHYDNQRLLTTSRGGSVKLWDVASCSPIKTYYGHSDHVGNPSFHPDRNSPRVHFATCCSGGVINLWNMEKDEPVLSLPDFEYRISTVKFHPSGKYIGAACFDHSWRLLDIEREKEILHQTGHSRECYNIVFHVDGSLALTGGFDCRTLVWDLRTGRCILSLDGHQKRVVSLDISDDGYYVASGGDDQKVMIWDLRKQECAYTISAHTSVVTSVKFFNGCILTSSFDGTAKVWAHPAWIQLANLTGHEQKVTCADMTSDFETIVTTSFDRTFKKWTKDLLAD